MESEYVRKHHKPELRRLEFLDDDEHILSIKIIKGDYPLKNYFFVKALINRNLKSLTEMASGDEPSRRSITSMFGLIEDEGSSIPSMGLELSKGITTEGSTRALLISTSSLSTEGILIEMKLNSAKHKPGQNSSQEPIKK
ncbi:hypothetical protein IEQ34_000106 [Dendrobium chrysotoxum]|uniref:Uncharacterized protein n=1 Tax=Dendrobium chrysotoxum TaxID=161865 RepID=A0AAV7HQL3_DENCH|nr:hypothetical protein IEQ34_000106 [Dendrobium chrysotoxum]